MKDLTIQQLNRKVNDLMHELELVKDKLNMGNRNHTISDNHVLTITNAVERAYSLPQGSVFVKSQRGRIPEARYMSIMLVRHQSNLDQYKIAGIFNLSPASISDAIRTTHDRIKFDRTTRERYELISNELKIVL